MADLKILAVDDEYLALTWLTDVIRKAAPDAQIKGFQDSEEAIEDARDFHPDVAFLDIEMRTSNGLELARQLKLCNPRINVIFTTGYNKYMEEAFLMHASGYIVKPVTPEKVQRELENLRFPSDHRIRRRVRVQTFGDFELFVDEKPVSFSYAKTKELLAILIDGKGAMCTHGKLISMLWEDEENISGHTSYVRNLISDLSKTLRELGCEDIVIRKRGQIGIDLTRIDCDYYDWLDGKDDSFAGEYMSQYSWAEETLADLVSKSQQ